MLWTTTIGTGGGFHSSLGHEGPRDSRSAHVVTMIFRVDSPSLEIASGWRNMVGW